MLSKHYFVALNSDDPDEYLPDGDCRSIINLIPKNGGSSETPSKETIKGTQDIPIDLPSQGENTCIGHAYDTKNDRLFFFIFNSSPLNGSGIYYWSENDTEARLLCRTRYIFRMDAGYPINHAEVIDGKYLVWTDGYHGVQYLMIRFDEVNSGYDIDYSDMAGYGDLQRVLPYFKPIIGSGIANNNDYNLISDSNFQFAYRYIFDDDYTGILSPISELQKGYKIPFSFNPSVYKSVYNNYYVVIANVYKKEVYRSIKKIEFVVRDGNYGQWRVFATYDFTKYDRWDEINGDNRNAYFQITASFFNNYFEYYVPDDQALKPYENIPQVASAMAFVDGRLVLTENQTGFDFDSTPSISLNYYDLTITPNDIKPPIFFKGGETYGVGVVFSDGKQKSAVKSVGSIYVPRTNADSGTDRYIDYQSVSTPSECKIIRAQLNSGIPSWATTFQFFRTSGLTIDNYCQFTGRLLYYISEYNSEDPPSGWDAGLQASYDPIVIDGRVYRKSVPTSPSDLFTYIHLQIPNNLPIQIDNSYYLRPLRNYRSNDLAGINSSYKIIDVVDDKLVLNSIDDVSGNYTYFNNNVLFVEAYKPKLQSENIFYACSDVYPVSQASGYKDLWGDTHIVFANIGILAYIYNPLTKEATTDDWIDYYFFGTDGIVGDYGPNKINYVIESPTPIFNANDISTIETITTDKKTRQQLIEQGIISSNSPRLAGFSQRIVRTFTPLSGLVLDYNKDDESVGAPSLVNSDEKQLNNSTTLRWSNQYLSDAQYNGVSSFDILNKYVIRPEKGPIKALRLIDNVLIAIHPTTMTSIYIGEGFIKQSDGTDVLTKTEGFIGAERTLAGNLGTVFPESLTLYTYADPDTNAKSTRLYGFDIYAAEPWRVSNNGAVGLASKAKMKNWFRAKADEYLPWVGDYSLLIHIVTGYDPVYDMFLITFPTVSLPKISDDNGNTLFAAKTVQGTTVGYSERLNRWVTYLSFVPEHYITYHKKLISFLDGFPYIHNQTDHYGRFHRDEYDASVTFLCNKEYSKDKIFRAVTEETSAAIKLELTYLDKYTYLEADEFKQKGHDFIADIPMDANSFVQDESKTPKRIYGRPMIGKSMEATLTIPVGDLVQLTSVNFAYQPVAGSLNV